VENARPPTTGDQYVKALLFVLIAISCTATAAELEIQLSGSQRTWSSSELLSHPQAQDIEIPADVTYNRTMHYRAVPVSALLEGLADDAHIQAVALDGFAAELPAALLLLIKVPKPGWPSKIRNSPGRHGPTTNPAPGRSTWSGPTRPPVGSVRSSGPIR
jgi:hypothetical protein